MKRTFVLAAATAALTGVVRADDSRSIVGPEITPPQYVERYSSGTPLSSVISAQADYVRSEGLGNVLNSQAWANLAEAQRRFIDNRERAAYSYLTLRKLNRELTAAERGRLATREDFIRYAAMGRPKRLTPTEIDMVTGELKWPMLLRAASLAPYREELQRAFVQRATYGVMNPEEYMKVVHLSGTILEDLRQNIELLPAGEYMNARRFLESLTFEARYAS